MPPLAIALVLTAAVLHAGWNVLLKTSGDPLRTAVRLQAIGTAVLVPIGVVAWFANGRPPLEPEGVALALGSGVLEAIYFLCLSAAYSRGDLSLVYPLARGSAPLLSIVVGIGLLGERLGLPAAAGVGCLVAGILLVARPWRALRAAGREHRGAIGFALATGRLDRRLLRARPGGRPDPGAVAVRRPPRRLRHGHPGGRRDDGRRSGALATPAVATRPTSLVPRRHRRRPVADRIPPDPLRLLAGAPRGGRAAARIGDRDRGRLGRDPAR